MLIYALPNASPIITKYYGLHHQKHVKLLQMITSLNLTSLNPIHYPNPLITQFDSQQKQIHGGITILNLAKKALSGILWAYLSHFGRHAVTFIVMTILARLLVPEQFGLIAFATLLTGFIETVRGFGVNDALIYTNKDVEKAASTVFVINVVIGFLQFAIAYAIAPVALRFVDDPIIVDVIRVLSLIFIITGFGLTFDALLQKELKFKKLFVPELLATFIKGIVSVVLAFMGFGVWSIVFGQLVGGLARTVVKIYVLGWIPKFYFYMEQARELWQYGAQILMFELLNVSLEQADQLFIGTLIGSLQLGYYTIAVKIPELIIANFSLILTKSLFPAFSKLQDDIETLTKGFLLTTRYTSFITIPAGIGMFSVGPELILFIYGNQWEPAIPLFQVLALLGMVMTLPWSAGDVFKAIGRPDVSTKLLVVEALYTFPLIFAFAFYFRTAVMASTANLLALCVTTVLRLVVVSRFLKINPMVFPKIFLTPFISAGVMGLGIYAWRMFAISINLPMVIILIASILLGIIIYAAMMFILERDELMNLVATIKQMRQDNDDDEEEEDMPINLTV